jgi:hypothetical protein
MRPVAVATVTCGLLFGCSTESDAERGATGETIEAGTGGAVGTGGTVATGGMAQAGGADSSAGTGGADSSAGTGGSQAAGGSDAGATGGADASVITDYSATWCNPLPIASEPTAGGGARSLADPNVLAVGTDYYLYATGGSAWVSKDLVDWTYQLVQPSTTAPAMIGIAGTYYLIDNGSVLYTASSPLGPWTSKGRLKDPGGNDVYYADWMFFADDDGKVYAYHNSQAGIGTDGIFATEVDLPNAKTVGANVNCIAYDSSHVWERRGDYNQDPSSSWLEAGWMTKHAGRYHLQYSAPGTEFFTYAVGLYTADAPLGPFTYDARSPLLKDDGRLMRGPGHHSVFTGPDGELWTMYHVLVRNQSAFERRLALDRVSFDGQARMVFEGPTETPQWAPGSGRRGDAGLVSLAAGATATADSAAAARPAAQALDTAWSTWWEPADASAGHWLRLDLGKSTRVNALRVIFYTTGPHQYRIETSPDGATWAAAVDETANTLARDAAYHVVDSPPPDTRYVRLTVTGGPSGTPVRVIELTPFGAP